MAILKWDYPENPANHNLHEPTACALTPDWKAGFIKVILEVKTVPNAHHFIHAC
ncbi:hypothetical protein JW935_28615 [candidate division KSB1 bacterium]|nr:hypothetical protein [candidate division KSB1 bacterium]